VETIISSETKTVHIGPDHPFVIIGERINPTGRAKLTAEMLAGDFTRVQKDAIAQVEAGAQVIDVNAGIPNADEPVLLASAVKHIQAVTDVPLALDSASTEALDAALEVYKGKPLVNSVTGEEDKLEELLPLVAKYNAAVIAISNDESGISDDPDVRFEVAKKIIAHAADYRIPKEDVIIDPLVMPVGAHANAASSVFELIRRCQQELGVNTCCGASNISFGMSNRARLNAVFLAMVMAAGMPVAITNPLIEDIHMTVLAGDVMLGHDERHQRWIYAHRIDGDTTRVNQ